MTLKETIQNMEVAILGNRINCLGATLSLGGFIRGGLDMFDFQNPDISLTALIAVLVGNGLMAITGLGSETYSKYKRVKNHIKEHGKLDPRYAENFLKKGFNPENYCIGQGLYLAARDCSQLDVYREVKKRKGDILPNF